MLLLLAYDRPTRVCSAQVVTTGGNYWLIEDKKLQLWNVKNSRTEKSREQNFMSCNIHTTNKSCVSVLTLTSGLCWLLSLSPFSTWSELFQQVPALLPFPIFSRLSMSCPLRSRTRKWVSKFSVPKHSLLWLTATQQLNCIHTSYLKLNLT